jgi:signal transduction histidine kinase
LAPWPLDIIDHALVTARFGGESRDGPFIAYLRATYADDPLDLIITIGPPAAQFVQRQRMKLFPSTPVVLAVIDEKHVNYADVAANDVVVALHSDHNSFFESMLRVLPETKAVMVVTGSSPLEKTWLEDIRGASVPYQRRLAFSWQSDLPFEEVLKHAAALAPHTVILWRGMIVDAAGVVHEGDTAIDKLYAVANAPIFSDQAAFFGRGIVGGPMHSISAVSQQTAAAAVRLLAGDKPADIRLPAIEFAPPKFDWRELQRWGIPESRLPPESEIRFYDPSAWEQYRLQILGICAALLVQVGLISWLVHEHQRRHLAEIQSRNAIAELTYMDRIATAGELSASIAHEINQPLTGITTRANAALRWLAPETLDVENVRAALVQIVAAGERAGDIVSSVRAMFKNEPVEPALLDINRLILTVLEIVRVELQNNNVTLDLKLDDVPGILGDGVQLQQVILNLVMNAIESMKSVQPRVLRIHSTPDGAHAVRVSIEDTGTGVDPANIDRIFKVLFTTKARGMGMGLSICRSIIENHGGRIWVSPAAKAGSMFQFELPTTSAPR